ncbi:MAG: ABC transporter permease [Deltaproteobacteria bacterium]|nr:ABC transporter permease [Deltaproteobacteria bacterium]
MSRKLHPIVVFLSAVALMLLYAPLLAVAVASLNKARLGFRWDGLSFGWYAKLLENETILDAAKNTLILAATSTLVASVLGTMLAIGLERYPRPPRAKLAIETVVDLPIVSPDIVFAAALVIACAVLRPISDIFRPGLFPMVLGHVTFQVSFVALVVRSRLALLGSSLSEASHDLYATPWHAFRKVTFPLIAPAVASGAMLAFTLSLDDFVISFFASGPSSDTLPIYIYASLRRGLSPEIHALSTVIVGATILLLVFGSWIGTAREPSGAKRH